MMKREYMSVKEGTFIRAMSRFKNEEIDKMLDDNGLSLDELLEDVCNQYEREYAEFMLKLYGYIDEIQAEEEKKNYNPDYEAWKKDPDNEIYKSLD